MPWSTSTSVAASIQLSGVSDARTPSPASAAGVRRPRAVRRDDEREGGPGGGRDGGRAGDVDIGREHDAIHRCMAQGENPDEPLRTRR